MQQRTSSAYLPILPSAYIRRLSGPQEIITMPFVPPADGTLAPIETALLALIAVVETQAPSGPATKAYRSAIRRKGEEACQAGGIEAMEYLLRRALDAAPDRAERREALIDEAWSGLPGWRS